MAKSLIHRTFDKGKGVFRVIPTFVPRRFGQAGRRLRLHPDDYYAFGTARFFGSAPGVPAVDLMLVP